MTSSRLRFNGVALLAVAALILTGCSTQAGSTSDGNASAGAVNKDAPYYSLLPQKTKDAGKIINASDMTFPPFESFAEDGKTIQGVDYDLSMLISKKLGVPIEWQSATTEASLVGLDSGRYDVVIAAMNLTKTREQKDDFVNYMKSSTSFIVADKNVNKVKSLYDLCGQSIMGARGTAQVLLAEQQSTACTTKGMPAIAVSSVDTDAAALLQVRTGAVFASVANTAIAKLAITKAGEGMTVVPGITVGNSNYGIMFSKDATKLRDAFQKALQSVMDSGEYQKALDKWKMSDFALTKATINGATW